MKTTFRRSKQLTPRQEKEAICNYQRFAAQSIDDPGKRALAEQTIKPPPPRREIRRPVDNRPIGPTEHQEQCAVIAWWHLVHNKYSLPEFALLAIPNGGARDVITGARLKAEGVRRGSPDLTLAHPANQYHGLYIEMKKPGSPPSSVSDEQKDFIAYLNLAGYKAAVHFSAQTAIKEIEDYLA